MRIQRGSPRARAAGCPRAGHAPAGAGLVSSSSAVPALPKGTAKGGTGGTVSVICRHSRPLPLQTSGLHWCFLPFLLGSRIAKPWCVCAQRLRGLYGLRMRGDGQPSGGFCCFCWSASRRKAARLSSSFSGGINGVSSLCPFVSICKQRLFLSQVLLGGPRGQTPWTGTKERRAGAVVQPQLLRKVSGVGKETGQGSFEFQEWLWPLPSSSGEEYRLSHLC